MMPSAILIVVAAILLAPAEWRAGAAPPQDPPDLTGTWKLQAASAPGEGRRRTGGGQPSGPPGGRPEGAPERGRVGPGPRLERTLTIAQTDSTITITGERGPARTYFTDGREIR